MYTGRIPNGYVGHKRSTPPQLKLHNCIDLQEYFWRWRNKQTKNPLPSTWIQKQIYKLKIQQKNDIPWQNKQIQQIRPLQTNVRWEYSVLLPSRRTASIPESSFDVEEWRQEKRAIKFFHKITDRSRTYMMHSKKKKLTKNNNKKPWKKKKKQLIDY